MDPSPSLDHGQGAPLEARTDPGPQRRWVCRPALTVPVVAAAMLAPAVLPGGAAPVAARGGTAGDLTQVQKLSPEETEAFDNAGEAVALDAGAALVGAPRADGAEVPDAGAAFVFSKEPSSGRWLQTATLTASDAGTDPALFEKFGSAVALRGDTALVGAEGHLHLGLFAGGAFLFERDPATGTWSETTELLASDGAWGDRFGTAVALGDAFVVVGADGHDLPAASSGAAYVFEPEGGTGDWSEVAKLQPEGAAGNQLFAAAMSLSGDTLAVGAGGTDPDGAVYLFHRDPASGEWSEAALLQPMDDTFLFGSSVALDGDILVAGAELDSALGNRAGAAYVFERDPGTGTWSETAKLLASDGASLDVFGHAVALEGQLVAVGAVGSGNDRGAVYLFERSALPGSWSETAIVLASDGLEDDFFGWDLAVGSGSMIVGASGDDVRAVSSGSAYVFETLGLGASVTGLRSPETARCRNATTAQTVDIALGGAPFWDCAAAGLAAGSGDVVLQVTSGLAVGGQGPRISGAVGGLEPQRVLCLNGTSGQRIDLQLDGPLTWDCTAAGLEVAAGDRVGVAIRGTASSL